MYEAKKKNNNKICNFWTFWPVIQLLNDLFKSACPIVKRWYNNRVINQNLQKCCINFASCIARILNIIKIK